MTGNIATAQAALLLWAILTVVTGPRDTGLHDSDFSGGDTAYYKFRLSEKPTAYDLPCSDLTCRRPTVAAVRSAWRNGYLDGRLLPEGGPRSFWLPIKRFYLNGWFWVDGRFFRKDVSNPRWQRKGWDCAILRAGDKIIDDIYCGKNTMEMYVLCQANTTVTVATVEAAGPANRCDDHDREEVACVMRREFRGLSYTVYRLPAGQSSWFRAFSYCLKTDRNGPPGLKGLDPKLATFPNDEAEREEVKKWLQQGFPDGSPHHILWIGLRQKDYEWTDGTPVTEYGWAPGLFGEEDGEGEDCVVATLPPAGKKVDIQRTLTWQPFPCKNGSQSYHLCLTDQVPERKELRCYRCERDLGIVVGFLVLAVVVLSALLVFHRHRDAVMTFLNRVWQLCHRAGQEDVD